MQMALPRRSPGLRIVTEWSPRMLVPRSDRGVLVAWLGELGFRFWCISPTAGLKEVAAEALRRLPHDRIVLVRETPGSRAWLTVAIEKAKSTAIHRRFTKQGH